MKAWVWSTALHEQCMIAQVYDLSTQEEEKDLKAHATSEEEYFLLISQLRTSFLII